MSRISHHGEYLDATPLALRCQAWRTLKVSWRRRMKKFKNTTREERVGRKLQAEARQGMKRLTTFVILPLVCVLPLLWKSTLYSQEGESFFTPSFHSIIPSSTSYLGDLWFLSWISEFQDGAFSLADRTFLVLATKFLPAKIQPW